MAEGWVTYQPCKKATPWACLCGGEDHKDIFVKSSNDTVLRNMGYAVYLCEHVIPNIGRKIRTVLWLVADDVEYVAERGEDNHRVETLGPQPDGPSSRLSTIDEEPSDLIDGAMFIHDDPNWEAVDKISH